MGHGVDLYVKVLSVDKIGVVVGGSFLGSYTDVHGTRISQRYGLAPEKVKELLINEEKNIPGFMIKIDILEGGRCNTSPNSLLILGDPPQHNKCKSIW